MGDDFEIDVDFQEDISFESLLHRARGASRRRIERLIVAYRDSPPEHRSSTRAALDAALRDEDHDAGSVFVSLWPSTTGLHAFVHVYRELPRAMIELEIQELDVDEPIRSIPCRVGVSEVQFVSKPSGPRSGKLLVSIDDLVFVPYGVIRFSNNLDGGGEFRRFERAYVSSCEKGDVDWYARHGIEATSFEVDDPLEQEWEARLRDEIARCDVFVTREPSPASWASNELECARRCVDDGSVLEIVVKPALEQFGYAFDPSDDLRRVLESSQRDKAAEEERRVLHRDAFIERVTRKPK